MAGPGVLLGDVIKNDVKSVSSLPYTGLEPTFDRGLAVLYGLV